MISIVLPTYNGEKYIRESIESVIEQNYQDWELIVIDDCSNDNTNAIVQEYTNKDSRIKLFKNEKNLRLPASLNRGFSLTSGDYLSWTSDDNKYKPEALQTLVDVMQHNPQLGLVFSAMDYIDSDGNLIGHTPAIFNQNELYYRNIVMASFMYTRQAYEKVGEYDVNKFLIEDYDYWLRISRKFEYQYINKSLYQYRTHPGSLTETRNQQMLEARISLFEEELQLTELEPNIKWNIYKELSIASFSLDRYDAMKSYISAMQAIKKNIRDLPRKVRVANRIGPLPTALLKKIYKVTKRK